MKRGFILLGILSGVLLCSTLSFAREIHGNDDLTTDTHNDYVLADETATETPVLNIEGGMVQGVPGDAPGIILYKGIPYAAPPVGDLRWKKPQPVEPWEGVRKCDEFGTASWQSDHEKGSFYWREYYQDGEAERNEDCLFLNIWAPVSDANSKFPVILWIHGGGFGAGFGHEIEFDGTPYAKRGVILITINYRLGMSGFLAHPLLTEENGGKGSGNYGLYDQLAALKWVKQNIAAFGGDPENVTVMGQSAGAGSVQALVSSPLSHGLIHRAVIQSGGGIGGGNFWSLQQEEQLGKALWEEVGITTLEQMRAYPAEKFQDVLNEYMQKHPNVNAYPHPCIDGELLTAQTDDVARGGDELDIPYMIGYTADDIRPEIREKASAEWSLLLESQGRKPAYIYCFCRDLPGEDLPDDSPFKDTDLPGAFHSSDLWYMFGTLGRCWRPMEEADFELSERMINYWSNFAKTGDPNGEGLPEWKPYTHNEPYVQTLDIK